MPPHTLLDSLYVICQGGAMNFTADAHEVVTDTRFACENHDTPGSCDQECVNLLNLMDTSDNYVEYDPTGCSYGPPKPRTVFVLDAASAASLAVTVTPKEILDEQVEHVDATALREGDTVLIENTERVVDSVTLPATPTDPAATVLVEFASLDREPDGTPVGYFSHEFPATTTFERVTYTQPVATP